MPLPPAFLTVSCQILRPFGGETPIANDVPGRLIPHGFGADLRTWRGALTWTHTLDLDPGVDIRDGCARTPGNPAIDSADGDEVRIPAGGSRYVVVWVEVVARGTPQQFQRAYLLRHEASWPDP